MSWGYFLDLNLTLPSSDWMRLAQTKTSDHAIDASWWGFREASLGHMFTAADFDDMTIGDAVALFRRDESICNVSAAGNETTVRLCQLLDKGGDPSIAKPIAALVEAARSTARGTLRLINDGTYSGEDGVEITADAGQLSRKAITDCQTYSMKLGAEIFGGLLGDDEDFDDFIDAALVETPPKKAAPKQKPAAKKPAAKKPAAKQPAAKKAAAKKPAAKKPPAKKAAAKKASAKKAPAKKAAAKKPAAKKSAKKSR
jgi:hypothetical protein